MKDFPFFILRHFLRDRLRTDGETESSTTRISTRISAGKVDTIDSLVSKTGIRPLLMIGLILVCLAYSLVYHISGQCCECAFI